MILMVVPVTCIITNWPLHSWRELPVCSSSSWSTQISGGFVFSRSRSLIDCLTVTKMITGSARIENFLLLCEIARRAVWIMLKPIYPRLMKKCSSVIGLISATIWYKYWLAMMIQLYIRAFLYLRYQKASCRSSCTYRCINSSSISFLAY